MMVSLEPYRGASARSSASVPGKPMWMEEMETQSTLRKEQLGFIPLKS